MVIGMARKKSGRPKQYREEFCDMLIKHMAEGRTIKSFAHKIKVTERTIAVWASKYPEFLEAKDQGHYESRMYYARNTHQFRTVERV